MPELFKRREILTSVYHYNYSHCFNNEAAASCTWLQKKKKNSTDWQGRYQILPTTSKCEHSVKHLPKQNVFNEHVQSLLFFQMCYHFYVIVYILFPQAMCS